MGLPHYTTQLEPASVRDPPRFDPGDSTQPNRALIREKRNDENVNVLQFTPRSCSSQQAGRRACEGVVRRRAAAGEVATSGWRSTISSRVSAALMWSRTGAALRPEGAGLEEQADTELKFCRWVNDPLMPIEFFRGCAPVRTFDGAAGLPAEHKTQRRSPSKPSFLLPSADRPPRVARTESRFRSSSTVPSQSGTSAKYAALAMT